MTLGPLDHRHPALIAGILGAVYDRDDLSGAFQADVVEVLEETEWNRRTITNTIDELVKFGAIHRTGTRHRRDVRRLYPTGLGRAWLAQQIPPTPGNRRNQQKETTQ